MIDNELLSIDNGEDKIVDADASLLAKEYYTDYAKYVLEYRALPNVYDGLKPVQRRIIYTANQYPQKLMKTAKMSGAVLAYHPHGSASITGAINEMASPVNVIPLFETKGNFGGIGIDPAADRYTELYLNEIARFNFCQLIDYADYEIGEIGEKEPKALPTLIPYMLFKGSEGIGIGLSTKVMPLNLIDMIDYYIDYIKNDKFRNKLVKPDVGYVLLEMTDKEIKQAVNEYKGKITVSSIVTQISNNEVMIEAIYDKSIDTIINKMDKKKKWFSNNQVGFRDASTTGIKYIFEIYDDKVKIDDLKNELYKATTKNGTYNRVVEQDGNAVYSSLNYVVEQSLQCLNKAIDNKIKDDKQKCEKQLEFYNVLDLCKDKKCFDKITKMSNDELIDLIIKTSNCTKELAKNIVSKPISYLTTSHNDEKIKLQEELDKLQNHNRKEYLIKLYKDFRKMVLPYFEQKKHSVTKSSMLSKPCIKFNSSDDIEITDGDGIEFNNYVYFILEDGSIYKQNISSMFATRLNVNYNSKIVGIGTDKYRYIEITTKFKNKQYKNWYGCSVYDIDTITMDKQYVNLLEKYGEEINKVKCTNTLGKKNKDCIKGFRLCQTSWIKK